MMAGLAGVGRRSLLAQDRWLTLFYDMIADMHLYLYSVNFDLYNVSQVSRLME